MSRQEQQALINRLAPLVWQERQEEAARAAATHSREPIPWYFVNISHPVIKRLYLRYVRCAFDGTPLVVPIGNLDRIRFELSLLHPAVLRQLAQDYRAAGKL